MLDQSRFSFPILVLTLSLAACGSSVSSSSTGGGGDGGTGGTASTGGTTTGPTTGDTDPTTTTFIGTTTSDTVLCDGGFTVFVEAEEPSGAKHGCGFDPMSATFEVDGVVTSAAGGSVSLDTCQPNTGCDPHIWTFTATADSLFLVIPTGTFVHASLKVESDAVSGCWAKVTIGNLAAWNEVANPTTDRPLVWLSARQMSDSPAVSPGGEIGIEAIDVPECAPMPEAGQILYKYRFYDTLDESNQVIVQLDEVRELQVERGGKTEVWRFGNGDAGCHGSLCEEGPVFFDYFTQAPGN